MGRVVPGRDVPVKNSKSCSHLKHIELLPSGLSKSCLYMISARDAKPGRSTEAEDERLCCKLFLLTFGY